MNDTPKKLFNNVHFYNVVLEKKNSPKLFLVVTQSETLRSNSQILFSSLTPYSCTTYKADGIGQGKCADTMHGTAPYQVEEAVCTSELNRMRPSQRAVASCRISCK